MSENDFLAELAQWRQEADDALRKDIGWLTLAGLFWLEPGENCLGTDPANQVVLPAGTAADYAGSIYLDGDQIMLQVASGVEMSVDGQAVTQLALKPDVSGEAVYLRHNSLTMMLIQRGKRYAIRLWDQDNPARQNFGGRRWYPAQESYRLPAQFAAYETPKEIMLPNKIGDDQPAALIGEVSFELHGEASRLHALEAGEDHIFIIFKDGTSGKETYPPGRYLYTAVQKAGALTLDFNRAYNPPCAFTDFATCSLPPAGNALALRVEAGELYSKH
ncbi:MAG: DUF1684 domain-containing protein [Anaerolineae bacterium]|nr:DUF1684 domain-containing protein [Anaerolineae bacterium]